MILQSCSNCWHNALQYGSVGLPVGYCVRHRVVLRTADETTCGQHLRKDLLIASVDLVASHHEKRYERDRVQLLSGGAPNGAVGDASDDSVLDGDAIGGAVRDFGALGTKIESIARLKELPGPRAELARLSLGRAYVRNCVVRSGSWTAGLHMYWWTRTRIGDDPEVRIEHLRLASRVPTQRQVELAGWALVMLRLTFIADVAHYASKKPRHARLAKLAAIAELAALASPKGPSLRGLMRWVNSEGLKLLETALPLDEYVKMAHELHEVG